MLLWAYFCTSLTITLFKISFVFYPQRVRKTIKGSDKSSFITRFSIDLDLLTNFQCHCTNQTVTLKIVI